MALIGEADSDGTSDEIRQILGEMGYEVPEGFHLTERDLDRTLGDVTAHDFNTSFFAGLNCENLQTSSFFCNPPSTVKIDPEHISLADTTSLNQKEEDWLKKLMHQGYECLNRMMEEIEYIDEKISARKIEEQVADEADPIVINDQPGPFKEVNGNAEEVIRARRGQPPMNPALRPVPIHNRVPGRAAYKHDPVKRYQMYTQEWLSNPPPGEKKRLALRWKVREYMLRKDAPIFKPLDAKPPEKKAWIH